MAVEDHQQPAADLLQISHTQPDARRRAGDAIGRRAAFYTDATMSSSIPASTRTRSQALQQRAERFFPGGVNSPVRAFRAVGGAPPFVERAEGAWLTDADGNRYIDYFGSWGPMILGHAFPPVVEAIERAARNSASFGASTAAEADLAERVIACYPAIEKLRFVSSGTEATMSAIRLARAATGRKIIVKFEGCYHGHADGLLVKAGSGVATFGIPGSAGVPEEIAHLTLALPYNDLAAVEAAFAAHSRRNCCRHSGAGGRQCRLHCARARIPGRIARADHPRGRPAHCGRGDDRLPRGAGRGAGALWSRRRSGDAGQDRGRRAARGRLRRQTRVSWICWRRLGPVYQAGTLSGNPLAMAAGIATVGYLQEHAGEVYPRLEATAKAVAEGVAAEAARAGVPLTLNRVGAMWTWFFTAEPVTNYDQAARSDTAAFGRFHRAMLDQGVWLPPSQFEAAFLSTAHGNAEVAATIDAARKAFHS